MLYLTKQLEDVKRTSLILAQMGIKVVGNVQDEEDLPDPEDYEGEYGDAYITEDDNHYWIFTRPFEGDEYPHWFDIGVFPAPGPEGPAGPAGQTGETGARGSLWYTTSQAYPAVPADGQAGDMILHTSGSGIGVVERLSKAGNTLYWATQGSIRGPKGDKGDTGSTGPVGPAGPAGQQGPQGQPGQPFTILGELSSVDDLPTPSEEYLDDAYVIPDSNGAMHIWYIPAGTTPYAWTDMGAFTNYGTMVKVGGQFVATFDADTKVTKPSSNGLIYIENGVASTIPQSVTIVSGKYSIATRDPTGMTEVGTPSDATNNRDNIVANKGYVKTCSVGIYTNNVAIKAANDDYVYLSVIYNASMTNYSVSQILDAIRSKMDTNPFPVVVAKSGGDTLPGVAQMTSTGIRYWVAGDNPTTETSSTIQSATATANALSPSITHV